MFCFALPHSFLILSTFGGIEFRSHDSFSFWLVASFLQALCAPFEFHEGHVVPSEFIFLISDMLHDRSLLGKLPYVEFHVPFLCCTQLFPLNM